MEILKLLQNFTLKEKKTIALVLAVLLGITLLGGPKTVAEAVDVEDLVQMPQYGVQDLRSWGQGEVSMADEPIQMSGYRIYIYRISTDMLKEYIAMMQENGFTLVGEHHQSSFLGSYQSYGLICNAASNVPTIEQMYSDKACHVNIWLSSNKWRVEVCDGLEMVDMGLRRDGSQGSFTPQGESLGAGLKLKNDKRYETTDGRMKVEKGKAYVLCDGEKNTAEAAWKRSGNKITVTVELTDDLTAQLVYYEDKVQQGDVLLLGTVEEEYNTFTLSTEKKSISATQTGKCSFENVTLRFMYMGDDGEVVIYLFAQPMDGSTYPRQIEMLCAVNTTPEEKEEQSGGSGSGSGGSWWDDDDEPYQPDHSKLDCLTCGGDGDCNTCGGYGEVERYAGNGDTVTSKCSSCYGSGNCRTCGGSGKR